jgi:hypothetical protein
MRFLLEVPQNESKEPYIHTYIRCFLSSQMNDNCSFSKSKIPQVLYTSKELESIGLF